MPFLHPRKKKDSSKKHVAAVRTDGFHMISDKTRLFEGFLANNQKDGFGKLSLAANNRWHEIVYQGNWKDNFKSKKGEGFYKNGYYNGYWICSRRHGDGSMWYSDGTFYDGDWVRNKRSGLGIFVEANGNRYEGRWKNDMKHGYGRYFFLDTGQMQEGQWLNDKAVSSTIVDIPYRQTAIFPTEYPIPVLFVK